MKIERAIKILDDGKRIFCFSCGQIDQNIALDMGIAALKEKAERENPRPLTLDELREMDGVPFYVQMTDVLDNSVWVPTVWPAISDTVSGVDVAIWAGQENSYLKFRDYGKTWIAYRHKPKEGRG